MNIQKEKKNRDKNFTERDKEDFIEITLKFKNILEDKKTNSQSVEKKTQTWENIANIYNSSHAIKRTSEQLKNLYKSLKRKCRKDVAHDRIEKYKTGGGGYVKQCNNITEKMLTIMEGQVNTLENPFDSSSHLYDINDCIAIEEGKVQASTSTENAQLKTNSVIQDSNVNEDINAELPIHIIDENFIENNTPRKKKYTKCDVLQEMSNTMKSKTYEINVELEIKKIKKKNMEIKQDILLNELDITKHKKQLLKMDIELKEIELEEKKSNLSTKYK